MNLNSRGVAALNKHWYVDIQLRQFTDGFTNVNNVGWSVFQVAYWWISVNLDDHALLKKVIIIKKLATL